MEMEITLPDEVPVMTLPDVAFFPQALMPLHILEPRYRQMLRDVLATNRLFAVAGLDPGAKRGSVHLADGSLGLTAFEPPHRIASVGIVRACQKNDNGTSNLLLQGLCRVEIAAIVADDPYRRIRIRALTSSPGATDDDNALLRRDLARLLALKQKLAATAHGGPGEMAAFLKTVEDPEAFVDIAAFSLCEDTKLKQRLLETLDVRRRLELFRDRVRTEIADLKLRRKLQGRLSDENISDN
ncbi:MAG: LON peptidase substrate-binding domain-containing protein [Verrucomicrobia bacterium]|nr:LON peptidase substrate-binding domain-containing protein [Verrucomicrobiota bacterium]